MTLTAYLKDKIIVILLGTGFLLFLDFFLGATGYPRDNRMLLLLLVLVIATVFLNGFFSKKEIFRGDGAPAKAA